MTDTIETKPSNSPQNPALLSADRKPEHLILANKRKLGKADTRVIRLIVSLKLNTSKLES